MPLGTATTKPRGTLLAAAAAACALLTTTAAPVLAAAPRPPAGSGDWVHVTVQHGERPGNAKSALLRCSARPVGDHPHAADACRELTAAKGDISAIPADSDAICPMIFDPVTAVAYGMWDGRHVSYAHTFSNTCALNAATGTLFRLDD
ncbi:SSI family serine proteinase inhibitor [Streptomyces beihaiensis]|uniref:Subtilase-type protease inhibitor n=1 Tax=Streptomyces beihaiensis TaxID=2984495 RepID=A0ABT3U3G0_9ACTN|nr:SSI family serine proteinase inhibitor [Streptomyces beihaiensis]MCX3062743.1 subtilase-type protease inhibitor [Streptomyces beihaiensis]